MCGRFALYSEEAEIREQFALTNSMVLKPRYNIAPAESIPIIRTKGLLEFLQWGFRPSWLKPEQKAFINARIETIQEKPSFRYAFKQRRCLIITNGYYEWKQIGNIKQPYFITLPQEKLFAFAGVWEADTCAIITQQAIQPEILTIHTRMPVAIAPKHYDLWLDPKTRPANLQLCLQTPDYKFTVAPVSTKVNNPKNDFIECTKALHEPVYI